MDNWADLEFICKKILEYHENGDPVKDVIEHTPYSQDQLLVELARACLDRAP
jgi:hypothetical protein